jgi:hypothetical protein
MPKRKKRVVYLFGSGTSHAILKYYDRANQGILMSDIAEGVLSTLERDNDNSLKELCTIPYTMPETESKYHNVNIENIISLYESSGTNIDKQRTDKLMNLFRVTINQRIRGASGRGKSPPDMLTALLDMYSLPKFDEKLCAILTMNYDNLIEEAMIKNYGGINLPFEVKPKKHNNKKLPILCKLHGSFNWENTNPVKINNDLLTDEHNDKNILWVPPGVHKRNDYYPFNIIWGTARSLLKCDILRIIGCSFSVTDLGVISLLHTTNRLRQDNHTNYEIEFIDRPKSHRIALERFPLTLKPITDIPGFLNYVENEHSIEFSEDGDASTEKKEKIEKWLNRDKVNIFELWLRSQAYNLLDSKIDIKDTKNGYFYKFYAGLR